MAVRTKDTFKALYGTSGSQFPDNTSGDIGADDVRAQGEDIADSVTFGGSINWVTIELGDWNMDTTNSIQVDLDANGIEVEKIRSMQALIRADVGAFLYPAVYSTPFEVTDVQQLWVSAALGSPGIVSVVRLTGGTFDGSADFDATSYNRGWITIGYVD